MKTLHDVLEGLHHKFLDWFWEDDVPNYTESTQFAYRFAPIIEKALRAAYMAGASIGNENVWSDNGVTAGVAAMADAPPSTNSGEVVNELVVEPTEEMVERAQEAFNEVWEAFDDDTIQPDVEWKRAIRAALSAALATARKEG